MERGHNATLMLRFHIVLFWCLSATLIRIPNPIHIMSELGRDIDAAIASRRGGSSTVKTKILKRKPHSTTKVICFLMGVGLPGGVTD